MHEALHLTRYRPIDDPESLIDLESPLPVSGPCDLLEQVEAISLNPVDTEIRAPGAAVEATRRVFGWDVAGVVEQIGAEYGDRNAAPINAADLRHNYAKLESAQASASWPAGPDIRSPLGTPRQAHKSIAALAGTP